MRYFRFALIANAEQVNENSRINLRDYAFNNPIGAVNNYIYKTVENGITFFIYRQETDDVVLAAFSFNERKYSYQDAYLIIPQNTKKAQLFAGLFRQSEPPLKNQRRFSYSLQNIFSRLVFTDCRNNTFFNHIT